MSLRIKFRSASLDQFIERYAVDVSRGGIFIRTREPLPVGTQLRFDFQLQDAAPLLAGEGTIVWIRENDPSRAGVTPGMGVRFDKLTAASQPILEKILAEKARREQAGAPSKPGPAGGMAVRRPSSTFSALAPAAPPSAPPAAGRAPAPAGGPPRVGGLSPLGAQPRTTASGTGSGPVGAPTRSPAPAVGSDPFGARPSAAPAGVAPESSGAFGRPRSTTGMNAQRPAPAPSALFEKPSAEDIDRALSVLTEVDGPSPAAAPVPVDFSSRVRRPTDAQPMVVEAMPDVGSAPQASHRRPTDAQPMVLEAAPDVGTGPSRRPGTGTRPLFSGTNPPTGETRLPTVPVVPLGNAVEEPLLDEEEEDDATSAWVGSGPTRAGGSVEAEVPATTSSVHNKPTVQSMQPIKLGDTQPVEKLGEAKPSGRVSSPALPSTPAPPGFAADASAHRPPAPSAPPSIMSPDFAAGPAKKTGSGKLVALAVVVVIAGAAGWYFLKGPGQAMLAKPAATPAPAEATAPAAAPAEPEKPAAPAEPEKPSTVDKDKVAANKDKPANGGSATPSTLRARPEGEATKEAEAKPAEPSQAKEPEARPSEERGVRHRAKRRGGGSNEAAAPEVPAAAAAPAVADVSPKSADAPKTDEGAKADEEAKPAGGSHVLRITSSSPGAEVIVDGSSMGTTPFSSGDIDPALPHSITVKKDGFESWEHMISASDWPRAKGGVRTLKLKAPLRTTGGGDSAKPADSDAPAGEPPPGLGTTPASPKRE